jgi:anti-sigma B factor antagonist
MVRELREPFVLASRRVGEEVHVTVEGELDVSTAPRLQEALAVAMDTWGMDIALRLDLSGVSFMDSWGFAPVVETVFRLVPARGSLEITGASDRVERLLDLVGWTWLLADGAVPAPTG